MGLTLQLAGGCNTKEQPTVAEPGIIVRLFPAIKVGEGLERWNASLPVSGTMHCAPVVEVPSAILCSTARLRDLNAVFARISTYAEGLFGHERGVLPAEGSSALERARREGEGHDLQGRDLLRFFAMAAEQCRFNEKLCPTNAEKSLQRDLLSRVARQGVPFVVVSYALDDNVGQPLRWKANAHHELLHAQFFLDARYRAAVDRFWDRLSVEDRELAKLQLEWVFTAGSDMLLKNELQAYLLMEDGEERLLGRLVPTLTDSLRAQLTGVGLTPISIGP